MKERDKYKNENSRVMQGQSYCFDNDDDLRLNAEDSALLEKLNSYFKGYFDIKDAISDPDYLKTGDMVKLMISEYHNRDLHNKDVDQFIRDSMAAETPEEKTRKEIDQIKQEIRENNLNDISAGWINEWSVSRQEAGVPDKKTEEIRQFIAGSLEPEESIPEITRGTKRKKSGSGRTRIISYISLAAAALIGAVFIIRSFLPSYNPDKIFSRYYEPYSVVSSVTRSSGTGGDDIFTSAQESYREGNYQVAATGFSGALLNEATSDSLRFFLGITLIALNDHNRAVSLLEAVVAGQSEFAKEARWYLGLATLKTGNKVKASECFEMLAQLPGFYRDRSEKILRRLK